MAKKHSDIALQYVMPRAITLLSRKMTPLLNDILSDYGLTTSELPFYTALQEEDGVTQEYLTRLLHFDKAATARAIKRLEDKGLVTRQLNPTDKRQCHVYLTEAGRRDWPLIHKRLSDFHDSLTAGLSSAEVHQLGDYLSTLEANILEMRIVR